MIPHDKKDALTLDMNKAIAQRIMAETPLLRAIDRIERLDKRYLGYPIYVLWERGNPQYVLRLTEIAMRERKQAEFEALHALYNHGVPCPEPHVFGLAEEDSVCYMVLSYIPGCDGQEALPKLSYETQFELGVAAGRHLSAIHQLGYPDGGFDWPEHRKAKHARYMQRANELQFSYPGQAEVEDFVKANEFLFESAPVRFQHDDYHPGNIVINKGEFAGIIDFGNSDWGDPIEDFQTLPYFTLSVSIPFALGQIQGYTANGFPENFWRRYNLYVAMKVVSSLVWTHQYFPQDMEQARNSVESITGSHDFRHGGPPTWYTGRDD